MPNPAPPDPLGLRRVDATPAARRIADEIGRAGPITVHRFMELALYDPQVGYYTRAAAGPGRAADYVTSPELSPRFGQLLARHLQQLWVQLGRPSPFWLIEGGPGRGTLADDLLTHAPSALAAVLRVVLVERSPRLRALQQARLAPYGEAVQWLDPDADWPTLGSGCVFANELLDAFPVHRLVGSVVGPRELYVDIVDGAFVAIEGPLSDARLADSIAAGGGFLAEGACGEVNPGAPVWVRRAAGLIETGHLLLIDYGEPADVLYGPRHRLGTLRCYRRQVMTTDPLSLAGEQDITSHVDLTAVARSAAAAGLDLIGSWRQGAWLRALAEHESSGAAGWPGPRTKEVAAARAWRTLTDPSELGNLAVVLFGKGVEARPV